MTEFNNFLEVWQQRPDGGTENELIQVGEDVYRWNNGFRNWLLYDTAYNLSTLEGDLAVGRHITAGGDMTVQGSGKIEGDLEIGGRLRYGASGADIDRIDGDLTIGGNAVIEKNLKVKGKLMADGVNTPFLGLFLTLDSLKSAYPSTTIGNYAVVGNKIPGPLYRFGESGWQATGSEGGGDIEVNLNDYYNKSELSGRIMGIIILTKAINDYSELDAYNNVQQAGKYVVFDSLGKMIGFLNLYSTWSTYLVQELESFKTQSDATALYYPTRYFRSKPLSSDSWSAWMPFQRSFLGENPAFGDDNTAPTMAMFKSLSQNKERLYESVGFSKQLEAEETVQPPGGVPVDGDSSNVFYHKGKAAFVIKNNDKYYTEWNNAQLWNGDNYKARTGVYFIQSDGTQYTFNGSVLKPTGSGSSSATGTAWNSQEFAGVSSEVPNLIETQLGEAEPSEVYYMTKNRVFAWKKDSVYYVNFTNTAKWNTLSDDTLVAKKETYFVEAGNKQQYLFNGSKLIPTWKDSDAWGTVKFAGILDGSETVEPFGAGEELTEADVFYSPKQGAFVGRVFDVLVPKYYGTWGNASQWNDLTTNKPRTKVYFLSSENIQYYYNGSLISLGHSGGTGDETSKGVKEITSAELDTTVAGGVYMIKDSGKILMMQISTAAVDSYVLTTQYIFENDGAIKKRTRKNTESWSEWEYNKQEAGDSEKDTMSQKAITDLVGQLQTPVGFNTFITEQISIEDVGSSGTGTKDNVYYYNYGSNHQFVMLHTDGKYYNQFRGQETWHGDINNPKTNTRFIDITGENYYYNGSELVSLGFTNPITKVNAKYDDSGSFAVTAEKLLAADYFFAKINFKVSDGNYVRVFFNGDLKADEGASALPITLVGISIQGKPYRMVATGGTIEIEEIV